MAFNHDVIVFLPMKRRLKWLNLEANDSCCETGWSYNIHIKKKLGHKRIDMLIIFEQLLRV
jgi:hypothetical protein